MRERFLESSCPEAYQASALSKSGRERKEDVDSWVQPFCQPFIGSLGLMESLDLLVDDGENGAGRVASLELGGKWMCEKITLCSFFVGLQGIIEN